MKKEINHEHDLGYKSILSVKKNFIEFLRSFVDMKWVELIREEDLVLVDKEFIMEDFKEEEADIVYKVNVDGKDIIFYVLLELQSKVDFKMPIRLLMYMTEIWRDELKNTDDNIKKRKKYRLPSIVPIVLYNGKNKWTAARSFKEVLSGYELFEDSVVDFRYLFFDVNRMDKYELAEIANVISSVFLLDQDIEREEIIKRIKLVGKLISIGPTKEQKEVFKNWMMNIVRNRLQDDRKLVEVIKDISEKGGDDMISNLGKNLERAFKDERNQGIKTGVIKGREAEKREFVIRLIEKNFDIKTIIELANTSEEYIEKIRKEMLH